MTREVVAESVPTEKNTLEAQLAKAINIMADWMAQVDKRLEESSRLTTDHHERSARAMMKLLGSVAKRLAGIGSRVEAFQQVLAEREGAAAPHAREEVASSFNDQLTDLDAAPADQDCLNSTMSASCEHKNSPGPVIAGDTHGSQVSCEPSIEDTVQAIAARLDQIEKRLGGLSGDGAGATHRESRRANSVVERSGLASSVLYLGRSPVPASAFGASLPD